MISDNIIPPIANSVSCAIESIIWKVDYNCTKLFLQYFMHMYDSNFLQLRRFQALPPGDSKPCHLGMMIFAFVSKKFLMNKNTTTFSLVDALYEKF